MIVTVTPPAPLLTVEDARAHLRIDQSDEDAYLAALIAAAQGTIDGPQGWLGRSIGSQTLELRTGDFSGDDGAEADAYRWSGGSFSGRGWWRGRSGMLLPCGPVSSVEAVTYIDTSGATQTVSASVYYLEGLDLLRFASSFNWAVSADRNDAVRVRYVAGYASGQVPAPILHAVKVMIGLLYENRVEAADLTNHATVAALLAPFRQWGR